MTLREKQSAFFVASIQLGAKLTEMGYEATWGDAYRDPRCPYGSKSSKHKRRLAVDLNLFKDGQFIETTEGHRPLGEWWETIGGIWGGHFEDGNHYEWPD